MYDFVVQFCGHGDTRDETTFSLSLCYERLPYKFTTKYIKGDALIGRARSVAVSNFIKDNQSDYLIFVDTDISFRPDEIESIFLAMREGYDIIAGSYPLGSGDSFAIQNWDRKMLMDGKVHPCKYVSTGFLGITRKALLTIREKLDLPLLHPNEPWECYPFFESGRYAPENVYISEDWDFCNKARQAGLEVYLHTGVLVDHVKMHTIIAEDVLNKVFIRPPDIDISGSLIVDLAEHLNKPFPEVKDTVVNHGQWKDKTPQDWLYELAQFNSYAYYGEQRLKPLEGLKGLNVLDYGCGIGTAAIKLSLTNVVMGFDTNPEVIKFARYRAAKHHYVNAHFMDTEPDLGQFQVITFIDMLEHIEDLATFLKDIGSKVKSGTRIYHFDAFFDHETEGHFDHSKKIDEYLTDAGFIKFNELWAVKQ